MVNVKTILRISQRKVTIMTDL